MLSISSDSSESPAREAYTDQIFREVLPDIPKNGPAGEEGLEYWVRRGDVLIVAVNMHSARRGFGRIDTEWVDRALAQNRDAKYKLVTAHLPVLPSTATAS